MNIGLFFSMSTLLLGCGSFSQAQIITTIAGNGTAGYGGDGGPATATTVEINDPWGITTDSAGNIYFADYNNARIRKVNTLGIITTVAGTGTAGYSGNGGPATAAMIVPPTAIAIDRKFNIYISNFSTIRKIDPSGIITLFAGVFGSPGFGGDGGPATSAFLSINVTGITTDTVGNVFISDFNNNRVRRIDTSGFIMTIAGNGTPGYAGDGMAATNAQLRPWNYLVADRKGNLFIADRTYNVVRKVNVAGIISTCAGTGTAGYSGDGGPATNAELANIEGLAADTSGNLFLVDNSRIRKVSSAGIITTIAGGSISGFSGDGGPATACELDEPIGIAVNYDCVKNIFISDAINNRIRRITINAPPTFIVGHSQNMVVCQDIGSVNINSLMAVIDSDAGQTETWSLISGPAHGLAVAAYTATSTGGAITPSGLSYTPTPGYVGKDTFKVKVNDCGYAADTCTFYVTVNDCALVTSPPFGKSSGQAGKERVTVFPNPNDGTFTVKLLSDIDEEVGILLTNMVGERVKEFIVRSNEAVPVAIDGAAGVYFLSATSAHSNWSEKIVVRPGR